MQIQRVYTVAIRNAETGGQWEKLVGFMGPDSREQALASYRGYKDGLKDADLALFFSWSHMNFQDGFIRYSEMRWTEEPITPALA